MLLAILHLNFSINWLSRIKAITDKLISEGKKVIVIEVSRNDNTYSFASPINREDINCKWITLFGDIPLQSINPYKMSREIYTVLEKFIPDVVISSAIAFPTGSTSVRWCRNRRKISIIMDDSRVADVPRPFYVNLIKRHIYSNINAMFVPAESHLESYKFWGIKEEKIFYGTNVTDIAKFEEASRRIRMGIDKPNIKGIPTNGSYFLGIGRQIRKKNWKSLIEAYILYRKIVKENYLDLLLVGEGNESDELMRIANNHKLDGIHFHKFCSPESVSYYYTSAAALILPSFYGETWGNVVTEAMASSLPVIVSNNCGCASSLVKENINGWQFNPTDVEDLAKKLINFTDLSPAARIEMGRMSNIICKKWSLEYLAENISLAVKKCMSDNRNYRHPIDYFILFIWRGRFNLAE